MLFICGVKGYAQEKLSKEEKARREKNIQAGNPFARFGKKVKIATLSNGKYLEFHDLDSIVTIGTTRWHVKSKKMVGDIVRDTLNPDAQPIGDSPGMWMSPDPLSEEFPSYSPYNMCLNNPVNLVDPDGRAPDWYTDDKNNVVYDKNINSQADLDKAKIKGTYIAESFVAKDQNGSVFSFNSNGSVEKSEATVPMLKSAGIDTNSMFEVKSTITKNGVGVAQPQQANPLLIFALSTGTADAITPDPTDAVALPKGIGYGILATAAVLTGYLLEKSDIIMQFAKTKPGKAAEVNGAEHTSGARASTANTHEAGQTRKQQVNRDKKRQNPNWKSNK
ncbi:hypothetical protein ACRZOL_002404 [Flavobacterium psychrophilum]|nr:hypothetical protein [Flavobacterium psychrophilum]